MSEPSRPIQETVVQNSSSASNERPAGDASEVKSALPVNRPLASRVASAPEPGLPARAETVSTLADEPGPAPEEVLAPTIAGAGGTPPVDGTDSGTFQLAPRESADSSPD